MDKKSINPKVGNEQFTDKSRPASGAEQADDVAWVLEHVSSPYRWEVLEVPPVLPISSASDKNNRRKLRLAR